MHALKLGLVLTVFAALTIAASITTGLLFVGPSNDGAEVFEIPGSVTVDMTEGTWGLYDVDGAPYIRADDVAIDGPGDVTAERAGGFFMDPTYIHVDGGKYPVFMRLYVPVDGTYDIAIPPDDGIEPGTRVVVGQYTTDDELRGTLIYVVLGSIVLGIAGLVTTTVGLVLRFRGRRRAEPQPM